MSDYTGRNLLRLMANQGLSIGQVARKTGLDERTVRGVLNGTNKPRAKSLSQLAGGLGVSVDEFFLDPSQLLYRHVADSSNPVLEQLIQTDGQLFTGWQESDFTEVLKRTEGQGDQLPLRRDVVAMVTEMNRRRSLHGQLDLLLDSNQSKTIAGILEVLCRQVASEEEERTD